MHADGGGGPGDRSPARDVPGASGGHDTGAVYPGAESFRHLLDSMSEALVILDTKGFVSFLNSAAATLLGWPREKVGGMHAGSLLRIRMGDLPIQSWDQLSSLVPVPDGGAFVLPDEAVLVTRDGTSRQISGRLVAMPGNGGPQPGGVAVSLLDLTEGIEKRNEILRTASTCLKSVAEKIAEVVFLTDSSGRIIYVSPACERVLGFTIEDLMGRPLFELLAAGQEEGEIHWPSAAREGGPADGLVMALKRKNGSLFPGRVDSTRLLLGNEFGRIGVISDLSGGACAEEVQKQRLFELEVLHGISSALRSSDVLEDALKTVLHGALASVDSEAGCVWLASSRDGLLHAAITRGWYDKMRAAPLRPGKGLVGSVFSSGYLHVSADLQAESAASPAPGETFPGSWGGICLPIRSSTETIGVLSVAFQHGRRPTPTEITLLESLCEISGSGLQRLRLDEATRRHLMQLQALRTVDQAIASSFDLRVTLSIVLEQVFAQLGVDASAIFLFRPYLQELELSAGRGFRSGAASGVRVRMGDGLAGRAALERRTVIAADLRDGPESQMLLDYQRNEAFTQCVSVPLLARAQVKGVLEVYSRRNLDLGQDWLGFLEMLAGQAAIAIDNALLFEGLQRSHSELVLAYDATIEGWSTAMDLRDKETEGHTRRVTDLSVRMAQNLGMREEQIVQVRRGAMLHDLGKLGIPDSVLLKPGPLTAEEWVVMKQHPGIARQLMWPIEYLRPALDIPCSHHEKWDGSGYPDGTSGENIPLAARIFAIADVWDSLTSERPYRPAWPREKALEYIRKESGRHFDAKIVDVFLKIVGETA